MNLSNLALLGVPSSAGARRTGQEGAPAALRAAHLLEGLRDRHLDVTDLGDLPVVSFRPDPAHPRRQNLALVAEVAERTADRVAQAAVGDRLPVVLGGDCSLSLGVMAGLLRARSRRLGLLYFDADLDLNTPETTPSGVFEGMVLAHALGRGAPQLTGIGPRCPLLAEEDVTLFGYDLESGWADPPEIAALEHSSMARYPLEQVRADPTGAAREALRRLEVLDAFILHFDVDVTSLPAADVPHPNGLDPASAMAALRLFVASPACAALVVTELNAVRDRDGSSAALLVQGLVEALGARRESIG